MAIQLQVPPEPLSPRSFSLTETGLVVSSRAADILRDEMRRYCEGHTRGRSFLIAGHRGAGKTTLVEHVFLDLFKEYARAGRAVRPLRVLIPGPALLGGGVAKPRGGEPAEGEGGADDGAPPSPADAEAVVANALIQVTLALHRATAEAFGDAYRHRALERIGTNPRLYSDLPEMSAQLEVELFEGIHPARLREFWARGGFLDSGILFPAQQSAVQTGVRELLALAGVCDAYRRISGELKQTVKQKDENEATSSVGTASAESGMQLLKGGAALLTGGLVGGGVLSSAAATNPAAALVAGLTSALGAAAVFRYSAGRSRTRTVNREIDFVLDLKVRTLDRVLPIIVDRLRDAGLAPIFIVDELDKVDNLSGQIETLVTHLKKFVSENAFFCFLADRSYFEGYQARSRREAYSKEYTYFSHQLFISHTAADLHRYLGEVLRPQTPEDQLDADVLRYVALQRAEMHTVDVQRVLARWRTADGLLGLPQGAARSELAYRLDLRAQVAVEIVLDAPETAALLEREPALRQFVYDALYYPGRQWKAGHDFDFTPAGAAGFCDYLERRIGREAHADPDDLDRVPERLGGILTGLARQVADLLADNELFVERAQAWEAERARVGHPLVSPAVWEALRRDRPDELVPLLSCEGDSYRWIYNTAGVLGGVDAAPAAAESIAADWRADVAFIRAFEIALRRVA